VVSRVLAHAADALMGGLGSRVGPFSFGRWPKECQEEIRNGLQPRFVGPSPSTLKPYERPRYLGAAAEKRVKLDKVRRREPVPTSIRPNLSLMSSVSVANGSDLRMVFDASKSKLNEAPFIPWSYVRI
jgi:hypothetical protein